MYYKNYIEKEKGIVLKKEYWGLRTLAYPIKKNKKAHYLYTVINSQHTVVQKIQENLNVSENIIKYLIIKIKNYTKKPSLMIQLLNNLNKN
jgi:small subunit ribosomal protein S6